MGSEMCIRDSRTSLLLQVGHLLAEFLWVTIDPGVLSSWHTMIAQYGNTPLPRLADGPYEILHLPVWTSVSSSRNQERMITPGIIDWPSAPPAAILEFRSYSPPCKKIIQAL